MKIQLLSAFTVLSLAGALAAADPGLMGLAMPNAQLLVGIYPDRLTTPFQQFLISMFPQTAAAEFRLLLSTPGLDSSRDIHEMLFATTDPTQNLGLAMA